MGKQIVTIMALLLGIALGYGGMTPRAAAHS
jgi:hypothetical protein